MKPRKPAAPALPEIPRNIRLGAEIRFAHIADISEDWLLIGRADDLPIGKLVKVWNRTDCEMCEVEVDEYVAERIVNHRPNSYSRALYGEQSRWVLATFISHVRHGS